MTMDIVRLLFTRYDSRVHELVDHMTIISSYGFRIEEMRMDDIQRCPC